MRKKGHKNSQPHIQLFPTCSEVSGRHLTTPLDISQLPRGSLLGSLVKTLATSFAPPAIIWMFFYTTTRAFSCALRNLAHSPSLPALVPHVPECQRGLWVQQCGLNNLPLLGCSQKLACWYFTAAKIRDQRNFSLWNKQHAVKIIAQTLQTDEGKNSLGGIFYFCWDVQYNPLIDDLIGKKKGHLGFSGNSWWLWNEWIP